MLITEQEFKKALSNFPTGVTIITASSIDHQQIGVTVSSFTSLSLHPPLVLFCLNKNSQSLSLIKNSKYFAVNILSSTQQQLARQFAGDLNKRWINIDYSLHQIYNCPIINKVKTYLICQIHSQYDGADHIIVVGQLIESFINKDLDPLIYYHSNYFKITK